MEDLAKNRHSLAHIMAYAVMDLYPGVKFAIGPDIDTGFYYDFDFQFCKSSPTPDDFPRVENQMREIIKKNIAFQRRVISKKEALNLFHDQPYKLELINDLPDNEEISIYSSGAFTDLCKGPHVESTKDLNSESFKIAKLAGAYWRGDEKNPMLTRIYAYAFADAAQLQSFLEKLAEAEKRDHRVLGQKLDLFHIDEQIGPGLLLWHPKGALLKRLVETYILDACLDNGYKLLSTPHIAKLNLWNTSGHTGFYRDSMFPSFNLAEKDAEEKVDYQLKPMNCPFHILVYKNSLHSYRELPIRYTELGTVYRYEKSGTLHGLTRVRGFTQDDAHIFCTPSQVEEEVEKLMEFTFKIVKDFGFKEFNVYLSTRPQDSIGTDQHWQMAESALSNSLKKMDILYHTDEGGGAFYGPKIDIKIKDALDREWQCTTIQVDFNLPERFDVTYINEKGEKQRPIMIHRALLGSVERFIGVLLEYHSGNLPLWLAPEQIWVMPISQAHEEYARNVTIQLKESGFRVYLNNENETIGKRIRNGEMQRIPYVLVVGQKEIDANSVSVRKRLQGDMGAMPLDKFIELAKLDLEQKN